MMYVLSLGGSEQALMCVCINRAVICAERCWPHDNQVSTARIAAQQCSEDCSKSWMSSPQLHSIRCDQSSCPDHVVQTAEVLRVPPSHVCPPPRKKNSLLPDSVQEVGIPMLSIFQKKIAPACFHTKTQAKYRASGGFRCYTIYCSATTTN